MILLVLVLVLVLLQYMRLREIWQQLSGCREALRWERIWESENRELKRSLRAECAQFEELKRQLVCQQDS